jgi:hypothetical protein
VRRRILSLADEAMDGRTRWSLVDMFRLKNGQVRAFLFVGINEEARGQSGAVVAFGGVGGRYEGCGKGGRTSSLLVGMAKEGYQRWTGQCSRYVLENSLCTKLRSRKATKDVEELKILTDRTCIPTSARAYRFAASRKREGCTSSSLSYPDPRPPHGNHDFLLPHHAATLPRLGQGFIFEIDVQVQAGANIALSSTTSAHAIATFTRNRNRRAPHLPTQAKRTILSTPAMRVARSGLISTSSIQSSVRYRTSVAFVASWQGLFCSDARLKMWFRWSDGVGYANWEGEVGDTSRRSPG